MFKYGLVIVGAIAAYIVFATFFFLQGPNEFAQAPTTMRGCDDSNIAGVVYSLENYPMNWETTEFEMFHDRGITIWIANEDYGLKIGTDDESGDYVMSDRCREVLYSATQAWKKNYISSYMRD